jgi:hypothetical protein
VEEAAPEETEETAVVNFAPLNFQNQLKVLE